MSGELSAEELQRVTGYSQHAAQVRWLKEYGLRPMVRPNGSPVVTWAAITMAMTGHLGSNTKASARPDFSAIRKAG